MALQNLVSDIFLSGFTACLTQTFEFKMYVTQRISDVNQKDSSEQSML